MQYTSFEFENFKGIGSARLDLAGVGSSARVFALVGLNESGKTTVLEAIDQLHAAVGPDGEVSPKRLAAYVPPDPFELIPIAERDNFNGAVTIRCGVTLSEADVDGLRKHLKDAASGFKLETISQSITLEDRYEFADSGHKRTRTVWTGLSATGYAKTSAKRTQIESESDKRWPHITSYLRSNLPAIWYFPNFLFEFPDRVYLDQHPGEEVRNRFYRTLFQDILDALDRGLSIERHVLARARSHKESDRRSLDQLLLLAGREVTTTVVQAWNEIFPDKLGSDKSVRIKLHVEEPPESGEEAEEPSQPRVYVEFWLEDRDGPFSIQERSLGFRWFFVYLLMTMYRGRRSGDPGDMLFLFDEPASNLHSTAQSALLKSFEDLSQQASVIYTTHSHHLINPEWLGTTYVVSNEGFDPNTMSAESVARQTDIRVEPYRTFASEHPNQAHYFQPILDVLDYWPSRLEMVPSVVMTEGQNDFYLLSYASTVLGLGDPLHFLPGGGAGSLERPIQLYLAWSRPFVVLLDSDKAGIDAAARYDEMFGPLASRRIVDLRDAAGDRTIRGVESLFSKEEKLLLQAVALGKQTGRYRKKDFARGVQEALVSRRKVTLSGETRKRLQGVLRELHQRLVSPPNS